MAYHTFPYDNCYLGLYLYTKKNQTHPDFCFTWLNPSARLRAKTAKML